MGADFGGVLALTPPLLWLLLVLAEIPITWPKLLGAAGSALVLVAAISWLDWRRGPTARTHLGAFFQRVIDGDAFNIIIRKAVAAAGSVLTPLGMGSVVVGVVVWVLLFRRVLPALTTEFTTLHTVAVAALGVAILGTALNDGGITIWYTLHPGLHADRLGVMGGPDLSPQCDSPRCMARRLRRPAQRVMILRPGSYVLVRASTSANRPGW